MKKILVLLVGPSCSGKTHLMQRLIQLSPSVFEPLKSFTTRSIRPGEVDGEEYRFVTQEEAEMLIASNDICQHVRYIQTTYGTLKSDIRAIFDKGKVPIRIVEPSGVGQFQLAGKEMGFEVFSVYKSESMETLLERWIIRYQAEKLRVGDNPKERQERLDYILKRMAITVTQEFNWINQMPYHFYFDPMNGGEGDLTYALTRIAMGGVPMETAVRVAPNPTLIAA